MKGYMVDDKHINIGSFNNDKYEIYHILRWSWKINNEANVALEDEDEAKKFNVII